MQRPSDGWRLGVFSSGVLVRILPASLNRRYEGDSTQMGLGGTGGTQRIGAVSMAGRLALSE